MNKCKNILRYAVYEVLGQQERSLLADEKVADVMSKWEKYRSAGGTLSRQSRHHMFLFKKHLFLDEYINMGDPVEKELLYYQVESTQSSCAACLHPRSGALRSAVRQVPSHRHGGRHALCSQVANISTFSATMFLKNRCEALLSRAQIELGDYTQGVGDYRQVELYSIPKRLQLTTLRVHFVELLCTSAQELKSFSATYTKVGQDFEFPVR